MSTDLAWGGTKAAAVENGLRRVWKQADDEIAMIEHARDTALEYMTTTIGAGKEIPESDLVSAVMQESSSSRYLATYVIDELRGRGDLAKNWRTGGITLRD